MKCKAVLREIEEMEANASISVEASAHLLACATCSAFAEERTALRQLVGSLERVSAPSDFDWRLRARLAKARSERARTGRLGFALDAQTIALAASFAFLVAAVVIYQQMRPSTSGLQSTAIAGADVKAGASGKTEDESAPPVSPQPLAQSGGTDSKVASRLEEATRQRAIKSMKANVVRGESETLASAPRVFSNDFGSRSAQELVPAGLQNSFTEAGPVISVPVRSSQSARLQFEDGQGTKRTLAPVSFGGQELTGRSDKARLVPASETGIW